MNAWINERMVGGRGGEKEIKDEAGGESNERRKEVTVQQLVAVKLTGRKADSTFRLN